MLFHKEHFREKKVIVTGGGRGIGKELCLRLARELEATVYAVSKTPDNLRKLQEEIPTIHVVNVDLVNWKETREAIDAIGPVDFLINCAGVFRINSFLNTTFEDYDECNNVNVRGVFNVSQVVAQNMIKANKHGAIVNISSPAGGRPQEYACAYSLSKASLDHLTKTMAIALGPHKIRVNAVSPACVNTDMLQQSLAYAQEHPEIRLNFAQFSSRVPLESAALTPIQRVLDAVLFCLSPSAPTLTGVILPLDGGFSAT